MQSKANTNQALTATIADANSGLVPTNITTFIRSFIDREMSVIELDTFEKASMAFQSWSNHFAVMAEVAKRNDGTEFLLDGSIPAPLSEPVQISSKELSNITNQLSDMIANLDD